MEYIIADGGQMEVGRLDVNRTLDLDIGDTNDFELTLSVYDSSRLGLEYGYALFSPDTEYGGFLTDKWSSTSSLTVKWYADTWRGMLDKVIIEPPAGQEYKSVSGEANTVIRKLMSGVCGGFFQIPETDSKIIVDYQFPRYVSMLEGLTKMLEKERARLRIRAVQGAAGEAFGVQIEAVNITDYSEELEYSQDNKINLEIRDSRRGINHLICLGKGELTEKQILHLYVQKDGTIGPQKCFTGIEERVVVCDCNSAEDETSLREEGEKTLRELMDYQKLTMSAQDVDLEIGDIIAGRDRESGLYLKKPILGKVLKVEGLSEEITYLVEGEK